MVFQVFWAAKITNNEMTNWKYHWFLRETGLWMVGAAEQNMIKYIIKWDTGLNLETLNKVEKHCNITKRNLNLQSLLKLDIIEEVKIGV